MVHWGLPSGQGNGVNPPKVPSTPLCCGAWQGSPALGLGGVQETPAGARAGAGKGRWGPRSAEGHRRSAQRGRRPRGPAGAHTAGARGRAPPPGEPPARRRSQWGRRCLRHSGWAGRRGGIPRAATSRRRGGPRSRPGAAGSARAGGGSRDPRGRAGGGERGAAGAFPAPRRAGCAPPGFAGAASVPRSPA